MLTDIDKKCLNLGWPGDQSNFWWWFLNGLDEGFAVNANLVPQAVAAATLKLVILEDAGSDISCRYTGLGQMFRQALMGAGEPAQQLVRSPDYERMVADLLVRWPRLTVDEVVELGMSACGGKANPEGFRKAFHKIKKAT